MADITAENKKLIENNPVAFATSDDCRPNVIGVAHVKVVSNNKVLITDNYMKQTKENLNKNNSVCLAVWNKEWNGIKLIGKADTLPQANGRSLLNRCLKTKAFLPKAQF